MGLSLSISVRDDVSSAIRVRDELSPGIELGAELLSLIRRREGVN